MRSLPIATDALSFTLIEVVPRLNFDTKQQESEKDTGHLAWTVRVLCQGDERPEVLEVRVYAPVEPAIPPLTPVRFGRLAARTWQQGDRSGVSFSADSVGMLPATNGRKAEPAPVTS